MAGMFYSLKETAEKLNKTEEEVKELAKQGTIREFRDGSNLLFKVDEVEALVSDIGAPASKEEPAPPESAASIELEEPAEPAGVAEPAPAQIPDQAFEPEQARTPEPPAVPEPPSGAEPPAEPEPPVEAEPPAEAEPVAEEEEILLAPETGVPASETDLTSADTALTGEGINVLGETDRDYPVTDDTMGETAGTMGTTGTTPEASLEEIEEDVNLDSFGSGSGLLDLSLQADDTSLGGILDEIYTTEGAEEGQETAEASSEVEVAPAAEEMLVEEEDLVGPQAAPQVPAMAQALAEPEPDVQSNTLGMLLFLPLLLLVYTAIVAVAGLRGVMPSILAAMQGAIWYVVIGAIVVAGVIIGAAFMLSRDLSAGPKKQKKPKKSKKSKKKAPAAPEETAT